MFPTVSGNMFAAMLCVDYHRLDACRDRIHTKRGKPIDNPVTRSPKELKPEVCLQLLG